ncbi:MAG TPA: hypothetical protein VI731_02090, partial [Bacteroidia bacterium]|nr:hypothetical protein [Bacteroidia bacterium]
MTRKTFLFLLLVPFLCAAAAIASAEVTIKISSHCDHFAVCETGKSLLEKELMLTAGVKAVSIDSQLMTVTVKYNPRRTNP